MIINIYNVNIQPLFQEQSQQGQQLLLSGLLSYTMYL